MTLNVTAYLLLMKNFCLNLDHYKISTLLPAGGQIAEGSTSSLRFYGPRSLWFELRRCQFFHAFLIFEAVSTALGKERNRDRNKKRIPNRFDNKEGVQNKQSLFGTQTVSISGWSTFAWMEEKMNTAAMNMHIELRNE